MFQILLEVGSILLIFPDGGGGHNQECLLNCLCTFQDGYGCCIGLQSSRQNRSKVTGLEMYL